MPLNIACVGREYPPVTTNVTLDAMQKYARAYNDDNPAFFDASRAGGIVAPPMFGVTVTWGALMKAMMDPELHVDLLRLVHGEQDMEFPNPIRPGDVIDASAKIISIEAKTTGETMTVELNAANQKGSRCKGRSSLFSFEALATVTLPPRNRARSNLIAARQSFRSRRPSTRIRPFATPKRRATRIRFTSTKTLRRWRASPASSCTDSARWRLRRKSRSTNSAPAIPTRLKRLRVRFSRPVLPGQTITTKVWADGERDGRKVFAYETFNPDGQAVIKGGIAEVAP